MKKKTQSRTGATTVEFALTIPILFLIVFGGLELGRASMLGHTADHAAYVAARQAIVPGANVDDVRQRAIDHLNAHGIRDYEIEVSPETITHETTLVDVRVSFPLSTNSFVLPEYVTGDLSGNCQLITERPPALMAVSLPTPPPEPEPTPEPTPTPPPNPTPPPPEPEPTPPPAPTPQPPPEPEPPAPIL